MKNISKQLLSAIVISLLFITHVNAQVLISSNPSDTPESGAMLEIKSTDGGVLIPRLDKDAIPIPVPVGLIIFDNTEDAFYIYTSSGWVNLSTNANIWDQDANGVFLNPQTFNVGVGTIGSPATSKFVVQADATDGDDDVLFEVKDKDGVTVFKVTSAGVRVFVKDETATKAVSGGFAVGRYGAAKGLPDTTYFSVTPYQTEVNTITPVGKAVSGGFAVGRYGAAKGVSTPIFTTTPQETRVYTEEPTGGKAVSGGFAVGRYGAAKGPLDNYMHITKENYFIGHSSGAASTPGGIGDPSGKYNLFIGYESGLVNTIGFQNTFLGHRTGYSNTEGIKNVFVGTGSGYNNKLGNYNFFGGFRSGVKNIGTVSGPDTLGSRNVFLGYEAGFENTDGSDNVLIGYQAGHEITTAGNNISIGSSAGFNNSKNSDNIFLGREAGYNLTGDGTANDAINNIFIGLQAGYGNPTNGNRGSDNIFLGSQAGQNNYLGSLNVFIGNLAGNSNTNGDLNIFMGQYSGAYNTLGNSNAFIGPGAGNLNSTGSNNVFIGSAAGQYHDVNGNNVYIGNEAGKGSYSSKADGRGSNNVYLGNQTGFSNTTGGNNVFLGYQSGHDNTTGYSNVFIGEGAGYKNTEGFINNFIGLGAGYNNLDAVNNIFIGYEAGYSNNLNDDVYTGSDNGNVYLGNFAGHNHYDGHGNNYYGTYAGRNMETGSNNVFMGANTGLSLGSGTNNVILGSYSATTGGQDGTYSGSYNVVLGANAGKSLNGSNNVFLGNGAGYSESGSNRLYIENQTGSTIASSLIYGEFDNDYLRINGELSINGVYSFPETDGSSNQLLVTDGSGTLSWTSLTALDNDWTVSGTDVYSSVSGNVGIGTTSPSDKLHIENGDLLIGNNTISTAYFTGLKLQYSTTGEGAIMSSFNDGYGFLTFYTKAGLGSNILERMRIDRYGNVGIGTTSPANNLHVFQSSGDTEIQIESNSGNPKLTFDGTNGTGGSDNYTITFEENGTYQASLGWQSFNNYFFLYEGGTNSFVSKGGYIGLNNVNPGYRLDLLDNRSGYMARFFNDGNSSNNFGLLVRAGADNGSTTGTVTLMRFEDGGGNLIGYLYSSSGALQIQAKSAKMNEKSLSKFNKDANNILKQINVVDYKFTPESKNFATGFIGEELIKILPNSTIYDSETNEYLTNNSALVPILTKALQEHQEIIEKQDTKIQSQEVRISSLEQQIQELKELIQSK